MFSKEKKKGLEEAKGSVINRGALLKMKKDEDRIHTEQREVNKRGKTQGEEERTREILSMSRMSQGRLVIT